MPVEKEKYPARENGIRHGRQQDRKYKRSVQPDGKRADASLYIRYNYNAIRTGRPGTPACTCGLPLGLLTPLLFAIPRRCTPSQTYLPEAW